MQQSTRNIDLSTQNPEVATLMLGDFDGAAKMRKAYVETARTNDEPFELRNLSDTDILMRCDPTYREALKTQNAQLAQQELAIFLLTQGAHNDAIKVVEQDLGEKIDSGVFERLAYSHLQNAKPDHMKHAVDAFLRTRGTSAAPAQQEEKTFLAALAKTAARYRGGYHELFIPRYEQLVGGKPTQEAMLAFANCALEQNNHEEALRAYEAATDNNLTPDMWNALGQCAEKHAKSGESCSSGTLASAMKYFARAKNIEKFMEIVDILCRNYAWHIATGCAKTFMPGLHNDDLYRHAATLAPSDEMKFEIYEAGGQGLMEDARNLWREVSAKMPRNNEMGGVLFRAGKCFKALGCTNKVKEVADIYAEIGWYDDAHNLYQAINFEPPAEFYQTLGNYYRNAGNFADAVRWYQVYLRRSGGGGDGGRDAALRKAA